MSSGKQPPPKPSKQPASKAQPTSKPAPASVLPTLTSGPLPLLPLKLSLESTLQTTLSKLLSRTSTKVLITNPKTVGRSLNYMVTGGAKGLQKSLNVRQFADLYRTGGVPMPGDKDYPDDIVIVARSTSTAELQAVVTWIKSRQTTLSSLSSKKKPSSSNPFDSSFSDDPETYTVLLIPHVTPLASLLLTPLASLASVHSLQLDLVPFDNDLLSLEYEGFLKETSVEGCSEQPFTNVAESIMVLQSVFGCIPNIKGIGNKAKGVIEKLVEFRNETTALYNEDDDEIDGEEEEEEEEEERERERERRNGGGGRKEEAAAAAAAATGAAAGTEKKADLPASPGIDTLVIIDREVDFATPLLTPLTYEGLIDEVIGIQSGYIKVNESIIGSEAEENKGKKVVSLALNSTDVLFKKIRTMNIESLGPYLKLQARQINDSYASFRSNKDASITEIHSFVKQIPGLTQNFKSLSTHINLAEHIKKTTSSINFRNTWLAERSMLEGEANVAFIETAIADEKDKYDVLKLLCLQSMVSGGIKSAKYDSVRRDFVQTYGVSSVPLLNNLEVLGALKRSEGMSWATADTSTKWNTLRRSLRLIVDDVDVADPSDIAYVSSGYAPLSVRFLQALLKDSATVAGMARVTELFLEEDEYIGFDDALRRGKKRGGGAGGGTGGGGGKLAEKPVMMVYYVGGVTFMEIAALRFLSESAAFPYKIVVATTKVVNGRSVLEELN